MSYNDKLDPEQQIASEELIAGLIFDYEIRTGGEIPANAWPCEEDCAIMGKRILALVLKEFRPDLIADDNWNWHADD